VEEVSSLLKPVLFNIKSVVDLQIQLVIIINKLKNITQNTRSNNYVSNIKSKHKICLTHITFWTEFEFIINSEWLNEHT